MAIQIKIDTRGMEVPRKAMRVIAARLKNFNPALQKSATYMEGVLDRRYAAGGGASSFGGPYRRWAPNKPSTIARKGHNKVLIGGGSGAGKLRRSIRGVARGNVLKITFLPYGKYAMEGFTVRKLRNKGTLSKSGRSYSGRSWSEVTVKPRPFAFPTKGDLNEIFRNIVRYVTRGST